MKPLRLLLMFSILSASNAATFSAELDRLVFPATEGPGEGKQIVLISGDEEYRSEEALPMLAKILSRRHGFHCTVLFAIDPETGSIDAHYQQNLPGMETIQTADLVIFATRFREPSAEQMRPLEEYLRAGKPVMGLRTATHGFRGKWEELGLTVLGEEWVAHHGAHKVQGTRAVIERAEAEHPILRGVTDIFGPSDVYAVTHLSPQATILLRGAVTESLHPRSDLVTGTLNDPMMPLAWLRDYQYDGGRSGQAFCTTMGASIDFLSRDLRRLIVNASYFLTGLEVPEQADVEPIDYYRPSFYGFFRDEDHWIKRAIRPSHFGLGQAPAPLDPPGTPRSYWRPEIDDREP